MDSKIASEIIAKYRAGICTDKELILVQDWIMYGKFDELNISETEILEDLREIDRKLPIDMPKIAAVLWPGLRLMVGSAAAVIVIVSSVWFFSEHVSSPDIVSNKDFVNDIAPGKRGATLKLANGKVIQLNGAKMGLVIEPKTLSYADGSMIPNADLSAQGAKEMTASTSKGQTYQFTLPDGSLVWLNADSKLDFPAQFTDTERKVLLSGEAYFQVSKDKKHPFVVQTQKQKLTVLGTHFNVNAYQNEKDTKTTLLEGSVRVASVAVPASNTEGGYRILKPNEQSVLSESNQFAVAQVDVTEAVAWKNNKFVFEEADIRSVMRMVERWYNVEVVYNGAISDERFWGSVSRYEKVSEVLKSLEQTGKVKFKIEGRRIYVSP